MIFILLGILVVLFMGCLTLMKNKVMSNSISIVLGAIIIGLVVLCTLNFSNHLGMEEETTTSRTNISSVNNQMNMILFQKIGTKSNHQVVIYKKDAKQKKPTVTPAIDTKNEIKTGSKNNVLVTKTKNWVYKNKFYEYLFYFTGKKLFINGTNTFYVKNGTFVFSAGQAKAFGAAMKQQAVQMKAKEQNSQAQAAIKAEGQQFVQGKVMEAMSKNPSMSPQEKANVIKNATNEFKTVSMNKVKQQMAENALKEIKNVK